jgi:hypothetical protein
MCGACSTHGGLRNAHKFMIESLKVQCPLGEVGVDGNTHMKWMIKVTMRASIEFSWFTI